MNKRLNSHLRYDQSFMPHVSFRFEDNVMIGRVEMHGGVSFGFSSYMNGGFIRSNVLVGRYCSIGRNVTIGSGAHDFNAISTNPFFKVNSNGESLKFAEPEKRIRVKINNDVWIGDNAYIMSGVNIGDGAIVAACSVVTKDVEPYSIVAGVPAKLIGYRFDAKIRSRLIDLAYWNIKPELLKNFDIGNVSMFLDQVSKIKLDNESRFERLYYRFGDLAD